MGLPRPQPSETVNRQESKQPAQDGEATAQPLEGQEDVDEAPLPPGFPAEDDFDHLICFKCVSSFPWIKQYAGQEGFLGPIHHKSSPQNSEHVTVEETTCYCQLRARREPPKTIQKPQSLRRQRSNLRSLPPNPSHPTPQAQHPPTPPLYTPNCPQHPQAPSPSSSKKTSAHTSAAAPPASPT
jgi:hypothetical protein